MNNTNELTWESIKNEEWDIKYINEDEIINYLNKEETLIVQNAISKCYISSTRRYPLYDIGFDVFFGKRLNNNYLKMNWYVMSKDLFIIQNYETNKKCFCVGLGQSYDNEITFLYKEI